MRPRLVKRVAARHVLAAFIPDKFFKGYEAEFKKLLALPVADRVLQEVPYLIHDRVKPLFKRFVAELSDLIPIARQSLEDRLSTRFDLLSGLAESYGKARRAIESPYPLTTTLDRVLNHIEIQITRKLEKDIPTLGKALKTELSIDPEKLKALANRALKQATLEEKLAIDADDDWSNSTLTTKYGFYRDHVDGAVGRLVKKIKLDAHLTGWFERIRDMLAANYVADSQRLTEFEIHGMKVVIRDDSLGKYDQEQYVKYLDAAYQRLTKRKLGRAWYGTVYIECQQCGGVNMNTGGGVGGHFNIGRDHVKIFSRPSPFIVELMAHELGHRYWFKSMTSTQRMKFEDLVKVRTRPKPKLENYAPDYLDMNKSIEDARKKVEAVVNEPRRVLTDFEKTRKPRMAAIDSFEGLLSEAAMHFNSDIFVAVQTKGGPDVSPGARKAWQNMLTTVAEAFRHLFNVRVIEKKLNAYPDGPNDWNAIFKKERSYWVAEAMDLLNVAEATAMVYVSECVLGYNETQKTFAEKAIEQWQAEQDAIVKPVLPVSDYGASNIDEAFAEAFMHYVMEFGMDADQEASFRAVLLDKDRLAARVAGRWARERLAVAS